MHTRNAASVLSDPMPTWFYHPHNASYVSALFHFVNQQTDDDSMAGLPRLELIGASTYHTMPRHK